VWGTDYVGDTKTLDVHIKRLRAKVEVDPSNPERIVTIRGLGYKFAAAEVPPARGTTGVKSYFQPTLAGAPPGRCSRSWSKVRLDPCA
jgi:hypothetical protein